MTLAQFVPPVWADADPDQDQLDLPSEPQSFDWGLGAG